MIDGSVVSYFSDHFTRQLMAGDHGDRLPRTVPKPRQADRGGRRHRPVSVPGGVGSGRLGADERLRGVRFETMSHVPTWKGNEFIALASDVNFDYPVGGFLLRVLRDDGEPAHARIRHHGRAARDGVGEEPHERLRQPVARSAAS